MTGLHWGVKRGNFEICEIILKHNGDVNAIDNVSFYNLDWEDTFVYCPLKRLF